MKCDKIRGEGILGILYHHLNVFYLQGASSPDPTTVYVDLRALRHDRVTLVERGSPHSLPLMESGKLLPGVNVIIADPETKGQCGDSNLGEIWVECPHNASGYYTIYGEDGTYGDHFAARLVQFKSQYSCHYKPFEQPIFLCFIVHVG